MLEIIECLVVCAWLLVPVALEVSEMRRSGNWRAGK